MIDERQRFSKRKTPSFLGVCFYIEIKEVKIYILYFLAFYSCLSSIIFRT